MIFFGQTGMKSYLVIWGEIESPKPVPSFVLELNSIFASIARTECAA